MQWTRLQNMLNRRFSVRLEKPKRNTFFNVIEIEKFKVGQGCSQQLNSQRYR